MEMMTKRQQNYMHKFIKLAKLKYLELIMSENYL